MGNLCERPARPAPAPAPGPAPRPAPAPVPGPVPAPAAGTLKNQSCSGYTRIIERHDGLGGTTTTSIPNSPDCDYVPPPVTLDSILQSNYYSDYNSLLSELAGNTPTDVTNPFTFKAKILSFTETEKNTARNIIANKVTTEKLTTIEQVVNATIAYINTLNNNGLNEDTAEFFITMWAVAQFIGMENFEILYGVGFTETARIDYNDEINNQMLTFARATPRGAVFQIRTYILENYPNFSDLSSDLLAVMPASYSEPFVSMRERLEEEEDAAAAAAEAARLAEVARLAAEAEAARLAVLGGGDTFQNVNNNIRLRKKELKKFKSFFKINTDGFRNKKEGFRNNKVNNFTGYSLEHSRLLPKDYADF